MCVCVSIENTLRPKTIIQIFHIWPFNSENTIYFKMNSNILFHPFFLNLQSEGSKTSHRFACFFFWHTTTFTNYGFWSKNTVFFFKLRIHCLFIHCHPASFFSKTTFFWSGNSSTHFYSFVNLMTFEWSSLLISLWMCMRMCLILKMFLNKVFWFGIFQFPLVNFNNLRWHRWCW